MAEHLSTYSADETEALIEYTRRGIETDYEDFLDSLESDPILGDKYDYLLPEVINIIDLLAEPGFVDSSGAEAPSAREQAEALVSKYTGLRGGK